MGPRPPATSSPTTGSAPAPAAAARCSTAAAPWRSPTAPPSWPRALSPATCSTRGRSASGTPPSVITITGQLHTELRRHARRRSRRDFALAVRPAPGLRHATLAGTLNVDLINGFSISPLEEFQVLTYGIVSGTFATDEYPNGVTLYPGYGPTSLFLYSTPFELVTNTADTGAGSLRQAITTADGAHAITRPGSSSTSPPAIPDTRAESGRSHPIRHFPTSRLRSCSTAPRSRGSRPRRSSF